MMRSSFGCLQKETIKHKNVFLFHFNLETIKQTKNGIINLNSISKWLTQILISLVF
ncbi:hypothetical protein SAMN05444397_102158 [Flavobacterium aquidurense]|nr:hypothetical protein SAMN05444397_102158 [Flavobacterium aquidurense]